LSAKAWLPALKMAEPISPRFTAFKIGSARIGISRVVLTACLAV